MRLRSIAVLGGGPGGLYAARLLKLADPAARVEVYEQGRPEVTFGFGVGLAAGTQRNLAAADPDSLADILAVGHRHDMELRVGAGVARMPGDNLRAIARTELLAVLQDHARRAGVDLRFGQRVSAADLDADLVVAADGVSSATRDADPEAFGPRIETGEGLYLWAGTDFALSSAMFSPVTTGHGTFVTHAYPYAPDRSTFLVETDEETWRRAGMDVFTEETSFEESDERSLAYLTEAFGEQLGGHPLIGNRTRWLRFRTVSSRNWSSGNVVLLGDAAHTAHYSIGSGTKLAMEDAIALVAAIQEAGSLPEALAAYEDRRRPAVEHLQAVATRSQRWWDSFPGRMHLPVDQLFVAYMTRAGKVSLDRLAQTAPDVVANALYDFSPDGAGPVAGEDPTGWVLAQHHDDAGVPSDLVVAAGDPWSAAGDTSLAQAAAVGSAVRLSGPGDRDAVLDRLDLAERVRLELGVSVTVRAPDKYLPDLAAGLLSGRTDRIETTPGEDA